MFPYSVVLTVRGCHVVVVQVIAHVRESYPNSTLFAAGWSLGANILVNYLGEQGADTPLEAAVSMCNPFDLTISNRHINEVSNSLTCLQRSLARTCRGMEAAAGLGNT